MQSGKNHLTWVVFFIYMKRLQGRHVLQNPTQHVALEIIPRISGMGVAKRR